MAVFLIFAKRVMILFQASRVNPGYPTASANPPCHAPQVLVIFPAAK
jgi:hypothetical protein